VHVKAGYIDELPTDPWNDPDPRHDDFNAELDRACPSQVETRLLRSVS